MESEDLFSNNSEELSATQEATVTSTKDKQIHKDETKITITGAVQGETEDMITGAVQSETEDMTTGAIEDETEDMTKGEVQNEAEAQEVLDQEMTPAADDPEEIVSVQSSTSPPKPTALQTSDQEKRIFQLPFTRIRNLMKLDPDLHLASHEATFLVTRATELFIESLARESYLYTAQAKKKTVQKRDVDMAIAAVDSLMFLDGAMNF